MSDMRTSPGAATRKGAPATSTSILKSCGSVAILLLFLLSMVTNAHAATATTTTLSSSATSAAVGGSVTLTASVSPSAATGTVTFKNGTTTLGTCTLSGGTCHSAFTTLPLGSNSLTAAYTATATYAASTSAAVSVAVTSATTTTLSSSATTASVGGSVTLTATVSPSAATGTVTFKNGTTTLGTCTLSSGTCHSAFTTLPLGSNSITAAYPATGSYLASTSAAGSIAITSPTTTTLASSVTKAIVGSSVTLTASVSPSAATGTVTLKNGNATLGTCTLSGGTCQASYTTLPAGVNSLTAVYAGNGTYLTSTSADPTVTMSATTTSTALKAALTSAPATAITTAAYGASVTLTATMTPAAAVGTVTFQYGSTSLACSPVTVSSGTATCATTALPLGANSLTAIFNPTNVANYAASTSSASTVTVSQATTTTALVVGLTSAPATAITTAGYGVSVTLTATTSPAEAGTVTFYNGGLTGTALCSSISPNGSGVAACVSTTLPVGSDSLTAIFTPTTPADDTTSTSSAKPVTITQTTTTTAMTAGLTSAPSTAITTAAYGASVTLIATVTPSTAAGTVTFKSGTTTLGSPVNLSSGTASLATTALAMGANSITATFSPTTAADYTSTSSTAKTVTVSQATTTTVLSAALSSAPNTVVTTAPSGASVTLTATVSPAAAAGTITFKNNGTAMGSAVTVNSGTATLVTSALTTAGTDPLTAVFTPTTPADDTTSTSNTVSFVVTKPATTTTLAISAGPYYYGANVTLTATVSASTATGAVTFYDGATSLGTGSVLSSGVSTLSLSTLAVGSHPITVNYAGDTGHVGSTSSATSVSVVATTTQTSIAASGSATKTYGAASFTLTATVAPAAGSASISQGSVTFYDTGSAGGTITNATSLGKVNVASGTAVLTVTATQLAIGKHYLVASYGGYFAGTGAAQFSTSASSSAPVSINGPTALTVTASSSTVAYGAAIPTITPTYAGWTNGDTSAALTKQPTCTTTYTATSAPGSYPTTCSGASDANYTITYPQGSITVTQAAQTFTQWHNSSTVYGTPVTLAASATSGGTVTYAVVSGPGSLAGTTLTPTGVGSIVVSASVAGTANYTAAGPVQVTVTVNQAPLVVTASSPATLNVGGTVPTITPSYATFVHSDTSASLTTQPTCTTTYKANSAAATYPTSCSGAVDPNYSITYAPGSFSVTQAAQTIKGFYASSTTYGTPVTFTATATSTLAVTYSVTSGPGSISGSILTPSGVGTIVVAANQAGNSSYAAATPVSINVSVYQASLVVTASSPTAIVYGTAVPTINPTYSGWVNSDSSASLTTQPTCFTTYAISGANSNPGTYPTTCYGAVDSKYSIAYTAGSLVVNQAPATVSVWPTASSIAYGHTLSSSTLSGGTASVAGSFAWTTSSTIPHVGGAAQSVTFTPTSSTDYTTATGTVAITVTAVTPTISTLPAATSIPYDSALSTSKLSGGAASFTLPSTTVVSVPGTFGWTNGSPLLTTISTSNSEGVTFTPTGAYAADYNTATGNVNVTVTKATPTVSVWPTAGTITYGAALSTSSLTGGTASVAGAFGWASGASVPSAGTPSESVTFTPTNATDYSTVTGSVKVTVNQATLAITWPTASAITYPQTLASSSLTGGSTTGRFAWTSPTTIPNVGGPAQSVTFTPTNSINYATETNTVSVTVNPEAASVSVWPTADAITLGQTLADSNWATPGTASTGGTFAWTDTTITPAVGTSSYSVTFTPSSSDFNTVSGWVNITDNACGFEDTPNSTFSTALNVETGNQTLTDPTLDAEGINESAVCDATPSDTTIVTYPFITSNAASTWTADSSSYGTDAAVLAYGTAATANTGATITINDDGSGDPGFISTSQNWSSGVVASMGGTVNITDTIVNTSGSNAHALDATYAGTLAINNVQATTTGDNSSVIATGIGGGSVTVNGGAYTATSTSLRSSGIRAAGTGSTITVTDGTAGGTTITALNGEAVIIEGGNTVTINSNGSTSLSGAAGQQNNGIYLYQGTLGDATAGTGTFSMTNGSISYTCDATQTPSCAGTGTPSDQNIPASVFAVANTTAIINLTDVAVTNDTPYNPQSGPEDTNGTLLTAAALSQAAGGIVTFNAAGEILTGDVVVDSTSTVNLSLAADTATPAVPSTLTGAINAANSGGTVHLTLDATSSWLAANGPSYLTALTNAGSGNISCQNTGQCSVYVAGVLQAGIQ